MKLNRLRSPATIVLDRISTGFSEKKLLEALVDVDREGEFWKLLKQRS